MHITVVERGDTLYRIAQDHGTDVQTLSTLNGIRRPDCLVPGQALLIPTAPYHVVRPGETLSQIAKRYGIPPIEWIRVNRLANPDVLSVGQKLIIPEQRKMMIETNAYLEPLSKDPARDRAVVAEAAPSLTYLSIFSARVTEAGGFVLPADQASLEALRDSPALPMLVVTNFSEGTFDPEIAHALFTRPDREETLLRQIIEATRARGYRAVQFDFENLFPEDRDRYTNFLKRAVSRLGREGLFVSTALAPKTYAEQPGSWYEGHDYGAHGALVNFVVLMTYEWGWSGGPPLPVAPLPEVRKVLDYAVTVIPRNKILLGVPLYGYDWTLPYVKGGPFAKVLGLTDALDLACRVGAVIEYDPQAESPYFRYTDAAGRGHIVWFEDVRSLSAKYRLVRQYRLRGVSFWQLGRPAPMNWALLRSLFDIRSWK